MKLPARAEVAARNRMPPTNEPVALSISPEHLRAHEAAQIAHGVDEADAAGGGGAAQEQLGQGEERRQVAADAGHAPPRSTAATAETTPATAASAGTPARPTNIGPAVCHQRSPVRSEFQPITIWAAIMATKGRGIAQASVFRLKPVPALRRCWAGRTRRRSARTRWRSWPPPAAARAGSFIARQTSARWSCCSMPRRPSRAASSASSAWRSSAVSQRACDGRSVR